MANTHTTLSSLFIDIANAIRSKTNSIEAIVADNFPTEIANLRTGFNYNNHNITSISDYEFKNCDDLKSVDCPSLISIGAGAFENCTNLNKIILYESVESIGENAFKGCNCTIYCMFDSQPEGWHENWNPDNCEVVYCLVETWNISATEADNVEAKLYSDIKNEGRYSLTINGNGNMKNYSTGTTPWNRYCGNIISITVSNGVTSIGSYAFYYCSRLTSIIIPDSVTSICSDAFYYCTSLTSITIPDGVTSIDSDAFNYCTSLVSIAVDKNNTVYHSNGNCLIETENKILIQGCKSSVIPTDDSVTSIGDCAFFGRTSLTSITIPDNVTSIGDYAFYYCTSLTSITIPNSVTSIGGDVFKGCKKLKTAGPIGGNYNIKFGWTNSIPDYAFNEYEYLTSIIIPDGVTSIGRWTFDSCTSLTSVTIPNSVTSIGDYAFYGCSELKTAGPIGGNYNIKFGWTNSIPDYAFYYCESLASITIPDGVTSIGNYAFYECESLASITIPDSVTSIGNHALRECISLTSITIPDSVTSIGNSVFYGCESLTSITIPDSVTSIDTYAFQNCKSLTSITIPDSVTSIGDGAFMECSSLTSVTIPNSVTSISDCAFRKCSSLTSVTIPNSVTSIGDEAFSYCSSLISINYTETISQWNTIKLGKYWNLGTGNYTIYCTDGTISKDGAITYYPEGGAQ